MVEQILHNIGEFIVENALILILVLGVFGLIIYRRVKEKKDIKKNLEKLKGKQGVPSETKAVEEPASNPAPETKTVTTSEDLATLFEEKKFERTQDREEVINEGNVSERLTELTQDVKKTSEYLDKRLKEDFEELRKQLKIVNDKKEKVKQHGLELAKLFDKYEVREKHITEMMYNIEQVMEKQKRGRGEPR